MFRFSKLSLAVVLFVLQSLLQTSPASATSPCYNVNDGVLIDGSLCFGAVIIDESVEVIGSNSFSSNAGITSVSIPNTVTQIAQSAFVNTTSLTSITLPSSLTTIGDYAFSGSAFTSISLPSSLTTIGNYAFSNTGLTLLVIPNSVTSLGIGAFQDATALTSITIPASVTVIADSTFFGATSLTSISIPNSVTSIGASAFRNASALTSISIPNSVTFIGADAFRGASRLETVTIPNSVLIIEGGAFREALKLTSIIIPNSITTIEDETFFDATSLHTVRFLGHPPITFPNSFQGLPDTATAFVSRSNLESFTTDTAFSSARWAGLRLQAITFPAGDLTCLADLGSAVINGVDCVGSITIPNNVVSIGDNAFLRAESLTSITLPSGVTSVGANAFESATALSLIRFTGSAPTLGVNAFLNVASGAIARVDQVHQASFVLDGSGLWNGLILEVVIPPVSTPTESGNETLSRELERQREYQRKAARANLIAFASESAPLSLVLFNQAGISGVTTKNLSEVSAEIAGLSIERRSQIDEILRIARKFEIVDKVASNQRIYSSMLQEVGLISQDSKHKAAITSAIRKLPASERSSYSAIKQAVDAQMAEIQSRKDRLAAVLAALSSRRAG
jgi:hypothetical protein